MDARDYQLLRLALHELRTPLTSVQLNAQLIERSLGQRGFEKECHLAATIISAARKLDALTSELGDMARLGSGEVALDLRMHDLARLLPEMLGRQLDGADSKRIRVAIPDQLPSIMVDVRRLERVVSDLIAIGLHLDAGGAGIDLCAKASEGEIQISITVATDPGAAAPSEEALGLRFFLARILVECHGGKLVVQTEPAGQVVLRFSLRLGRA